MCRLFATIFFTSACLYSTAQEKYFPVDEIPFESDYQKELIIQAMEGIIDTKSFLSVAVEDSSKFDKWTNFYRNEIADLKERKEVKKLQKDVKNIYDALHETFLRKYEHLAYYDQIFESGIYNCVTAVALYALTFDELGIPYKIKETPTHVYIVVDPDNTQLLIETTDPISGFQNFGPGFKERFVAELAGLKLIDRTDIQEKGIDGVFDEAYFGGDNLDLQQLMGLQFYNQGITALQDKNYEAAWQLLAKAQLFHTNDQLDRALLGSITAYINQSDYSNGEWAYLPYLDRFDSHYITNEMIIAEFARVINNLLLARNDSETSDQAYQHFVKTVTDTTLITRADFIYNYERGRVLFNRARYIEAIDWIARAYLAQPGNIEAETLLLSTFSNGYERKDPEEAEVKLDSLLGELPELAENYHINEIRTNLILIRMHDAFDQRQVSKGLEAKQEFESLIATYPNYAYDRGILGNAYSKASVYYFRRGSRSKAREMVRKGLEYDPDNYELKSRLRMLNY